MGLPLAMILLRRENQRFELSVDTPGLIQLQQQTLIEMQLTPNPAQDEVTLNYSGSNKSDKNLEMINAAGTIVLSKDLGPDQSGAIQLDIRKLSQVYIW